VTTTRPTIFGGTKTTVTTYDASGNQSKAVTRSNPRFGTSSVTTTMSGGSTVTEKTRGTRTETILRDPGGKELFRSASGGKSN
jgi:hypothetical protein